MGATMRQTLGGIANAIEEDQKQIRALQLAQLEAIQDASDICCGQVCEAYMKHPAPWHSEG